MSTVADRYEPNDTGLAVDRIDVPKTANAKLPSPVEFAEKRHATFWLGGNDTNCRLDGPFKVGMERADDLGHMGKDVRTEWESGVRRF